MFHSDRRCREGVSGYQLDTIDFATPTRERPERRRGDGADEEFELSGTISSDREILSDEMEDTGPPQESRV